MAKTNKKQSKTSVKVPPGRTVVASGGALTLTAIHMACRTVESKKKTVNTAFIHPDRLPDLKEILLSELKDGPKILKIKPIRFADAYNELNELVEKGYVSPERTIAIQVSENVPKNTMLLAVKSGKSSKFAKVVVEQD